jgi:hypothetical protein
MDSDMNGREYLNAIGWSLIGVGTSLEFIQLHGLTILSVIALVTGSACQIVQTHIKIRQDQARRVFDKQRLNYIQKYQQPPW